MLSLVVAAALAALPTGQVSITERGFVAITERGTPVKVCVITDRAPAKANYVTKTVKVFSTRAPQGDHTHTCTSCGATWDHAANKTHECQFCGGHPPIARGGGFLADPVRRPVTVVTTKTVHEAAAPVLAKAAAPPAQQPRAPVFEAPIVFRSMQSSNCANGQCSTITRGKRGR